MNGVIAVLANRNSSAPTINNTIITGNNQYFLCLKINLNMLFTVLSLSLIIIIIHKGKYKTILIF